MNASHLREAPKLANEKSTTGRVTKRFNANLPVETHEEIERLSREHNWTFTELIRLALSLLKVAYEAIREGNRLAVVNKKGRVVKEILLPS